MFNQREECEGGFFDARAKEALEEKSPFLTNTWLVEEKKKQIWEKNLFQISIFFD